MHVITNTKVCFDKERLNSCNMNHDNYAGVSKADRLIC